MTRACLLTLAGLCVATPVAADVPGPNDDLCTLEVQQRDGSQCASCSVRVGEDRSACEELAARPGWSRRCSVGATFSTTIYCDREADYVEVGARGCACRAAGRGHGEAWALGALGALLARRRRRGVPSR